MATTATSSKKLTYYVYKSGNNTDPIRRALNNRGWEPVDVDEAKASDYWFANFIWKPTWTNVKPCTSLFARQHSNASKRQVWNHFKAVEPLCTKDSLFETMRTYYASAGEEPFKHLPPTFLVEPKLGDVENWPGWTDFSNHFNKCANDPSVKRNLWLVKPTSANRGIGIEVFSSVSEIKSFLETKARGASMGIAPVWVLQKYIENPLLYRNRKFDLRVWVLALDNGDIYIHAPGYVRTSSEVFDLESTNRYAHLTNYCQQVNAESFGKFEEGNTLTFNDLENYLTEILSKRGPTTVKNSVSSSSSSSASTDSSKDKLVNEATTGVEVMWGCGKNGLWGQMRSAVIDTFEALRGRGGSRSCGYEENGYARKAGPGISVPTGKGGITTDNPVATNRTAGPSGSRHRFELLGFDFMIDSDFKIHFIEVNTNPSLSYQNDWHEGFVDDMAERLLDVVFADVFPELGTAPDEASIAGSPELDNKRPEWSWQWVMNTYSSPLRHASTASVQAAADAFRSSRNITKTGTPTSTSSATNTTSNVSTSTVNRTISLAASKLLANKNKKETVNKETKAIPSVLSVLSSSKNTTTEEISPSSLHSEESKDNDAFINSVTSIDTVSALSIDTEQRDSMDDDSKESDEDNGRTSGAENIDSSVVVGIVTTINNRTDTVSTGSMNKNGTVNNQSGTDNTTTSGTTLLNSTTTNNVVVALGTNRSVSIPRIGGKNSSIPRSTKGDGSSSLDDPNHRSSSAMKGSRVINKVPTNRVAAVFRASNENGILTPDGSSNGNMSLSIIGMTTDNNNSSSSSSSNNSANEGTNSNRSSSRLRINPNAAELGITGAGLIKTVSNTPTNQPPRSSSMSRSTTGNLPLSSSSSLGNYVMGNGNILDVSAIDTDVLLNLEQGQGSSYPPLGSTGTVPPMSPIRVGR